MDKTLEQLREEGWQIEDEKPVLLDPTAPHKHVLRIYQDSATAWHVVYGGRGSMYDGEHYHSFDDDEHGHIHREEKYFTSASSSERKLKRAARDLIRKHDDEVRSNSRAAKVFSHESLRSIVNAEHRP